MQIQVLQNITIITYRYAMYTNTVKKYVEKKSTRSLFNGLTLQPVHTTSWLTKQSAELTVQSGFGPKHQETNNREMLSAVSLAQTKSSCNIIVFHRVSSVSCQLGEICLTASGEKKLGLKNYLPSLLGSKKKKIKMLFKKV